ncbi:hypothetical protein EC912_102321 [Luteibacter rhizovicinus]|uniref:Copper chaperone NosL n=2 Tax=Luteibacter rhizovicinus TaxID=242606 RepID=A0A4R3YXD1_9GAMM|nr:hypothetical protein EC912_102321 [Luteibacter rhizovicinus]
MRSLTKCVALSLLVALPATSMGPLRAQTASAAATDREFSGTYQAADPEQPGIGFQFKIARKKSALRLYVIPDDIDCDPIPWLAEDGKTPIQVHAASPSKLKQLVGDHANQVHAIDLDGVGILVHAPAGWRLNEHFVTQTGYFMAPATDSQVMADARPVDMKKVDPESLCPADRWRKAGIRPI